MKQGDLKNLVIATKQQAGKPAKPRGRRGKDAAEFVGDAAGKDGAPLPKATYYVEDRQKRALKALAAQQGRPVSELVRDIFDRFLGD